MAVTATFVDRQWIGTQIRETWKLVTNGVANGTMTLPFRPQLVDHDASSGAIDCDGFPDAEGATINASSDIGLHSTTVTVTQAASKTRYITFKSNNPGLKN
jgi:hypothetical protein